MRAYPERSPTSPRANTTGFCSLLGQKSWLQLRRAIRYLQRGTLRAITCPACLQAPPIEGPAYKSHRLACGHAYCGCGQELVLVKCSRRGERTGRDDAATLSSGTDARASVDSLRPSAGGQLHICSKHSGGHTRLYSRGLC